jgi:PKD repeat protein
VVGGVSLDDIAWHFGDGTTANGSLSVNHTYAAAGTYEVSLELIDALGITVWAYDNVTLSAPTGTLVAVAVDLTTTGPAPLTVTFAGSASGGTGPYSFAWAFGDGGTGSGPSPTHVFTAQGEFDTVLTVTDSASATAQASVLVVVLPPVGTFAATISANVTTGTAPLAVSFHGSATGGVAPYTYLWTFGDGSATVSGNATAHTYAATGSYVATLLVTDSQGATVTAAIAVVATSPSGNLVASARAVVTVGVAPFLASFIGTADGGTAPYTFTWNFGDGAGTVTGNLVAHLYVDSGTYLATLTVADARGNVTTAHAQVTVASSTPGALQVTASTTVSSGVAPLTVDFAADATGGVAPYVYLWSFGDGQASALANPAFTYTTPGSYTASLVVTDAAGATALSFVNLQVFTTALGLSIGASEEVTALSASSESVAFLASAHGGAAPYTYLWSFGDGTVASTVDAPTHTFASSGDFAISLRVTDSEGVSANYNLNLVVVLSGLLVVSSGAPTPGQSNLSWSFAAAAAGGSGPYHYSWSFGDGSAVVTGATAAHAFASGGTYLVVVTATNAQGNSTVHDMVVNVPTTAAPTSSALFSALLVIGVGSVLGILVGVLSFQRRRMTAQHRGGRPRTPGERTSDVALSADVVLRADVVLSPDVVLSADVVLGTELEKLPPEKDVLDDMF